MSSPRACVVFDDIFYIMYIFAIRRYIYNKKRFFTILPHILPTMLLFEIKLSSTFLINSTSVGIPRLFTKVWMFCSVSILFYFCNDGQNGFLDVLVLLVVLFIMLPSIILSSIMLFIVLFLHFVVHASFFKFYSKIILFQERFCSGLKGRRPFWLLNPPAKGGS